MYDFAFSPDSQCIVTYEGDHRTDSLFESLYEQRTICLRVHDLATGTVVTQMEPPLTRADEMEMVWQDYSMPPATPAEVGDIVIVKNEGAMFGCLETLFSRKYQYAVVTGHTPQGKLSLELKHPNAHSKPVTATQSAVRVVDMPRLWVALLPLEMDLGSPTSTHRDRDWSIDMNAAIIVKQCSGAYRCGIMKRRGKEPNKVVCQDWITKSSVECDLREDEAKLLRISKKGFEALPFVGSSKPSCALSQDGHSLIASCGRSVFIWNAATGNLRCSFSGHSTGVLGFSISAAGNAAVSHSDHVSKGSGTDTVYLPAEVKVWDAGTGETYHTLQLETRPHERRRCEMSRDGRLTVVQGDRSICIYNTKSGALIFQDTGHGSSHALLSPSGNHLVTFSSNCRSKTTRFCFLDTFNGVWTVMLQGNADTLTNPFPVLGADGKSILAVTRDILGHQFTCWALPHFVTFA